MIPNAWSTNMRQTYQCEDTTPVKCSSSAPPAPPEQGPEEPSVPPGGLAEDQPGLGGLQAQQPRPGAGGEAAAGGAVSRERLRDTHTQGREGRRVGFQEEGHLISSLLWALQRQQQPAAEQPQAGAPGEGDEDAGGRGARQPAEREGPGQS